MAPSARAAPDPSLAAQALALAIGAAGVYASYLTQGLVQEELATARFGPRGDRFPGLDALHGLQAAACAVWAGALVLAMDWRAKSRGKGRRAPPLAARAPPRAYWRAGLSNSVGPTLGVLALKNISYPAQVLAKSCKMLPVMLAGAVVSGKRHSPAEYAAAAAIAGGVALFAGTTPGAAAKRLAAPNAALGYGLCVANLALDGYTNAAQDALHAAHPATPALWTMAWMNAWSGGVTLAYLFGATGKGARALAFLAAHPPAAARVALFCACGAVGQLFIFYNIARFGSLTNTTITTTRKFFNILLSVAVAGTALSVPQWLAVALVFSGLAVSAGVKAGKKQGVKRKGH